MRGGNRILIAVVVLCLLAAFPTRPACAGDGVWTTLNTTPYSPIDLAIDPGSPAYVYALGPQVTLGSRDGGGEWTLASDVPHGTSQLVFDPLTPSIVYAISGGQLQRRIGAEGWTAQAPGLLNEVMGLTINPDNPNQLWVVTASDLLRSEDGGDSWTRNMLPAAVNVTAFTLGSPDRQHVYAALAGQGFFHSADGGASWERAGAGLERVGGIYALQADGSMAGMLYLAADAGLYRSDDHGAYWKPLDPPHPGYRSRVLLWTAAGGGTVYTAVGDVVYRSNDQGAAWQAVRPAEGRELSRLTAESGNPAVMYAIANGAVLKSFDAGVSWTQPPALGSYVVVAAHPTRAGLLLADSDNGSAWRSTDGGRTWAPLQGGWPGGINVGSFHMHAGDPDHMFAAAGGLLLTSRDAGQNWSSTGMPSADVPRAITTAPGDPALVMVSLGRAILRSNDGGAFWRGAQLWGDALRANDLWISPEDATLALAATTQGVYRSTDGGASWQPVVGIGQVNCRDLWSGAGPGEVVANTADGLAASSDSGATWSSSPPGTGLPGGAQRIVRDWSDANVLYGARGDRVFISSDSGQLWTPVGDALPFTPVSLAVDGVTPRQLYVEDGEGRQQWRFTLPEISPAPTPVLAATASTTPDATWTSQSEAAEMPTAPVVPLATSSPAQATGDRVPGAWVLALGGAAAVVLAGAGGILFARRRARLTARKEE